MNFAEALNQCAAKDFESVVSSSPDRTEVTDYVAGWRAGYVRALRDYRTSLLEDFSMPPQAVDLYESAARARGGEDEP